MRNPRPETGCGQLDVFLVFILHYSFRDALHLLLLFLWFQCTNTRSPPGSGIPTTRVKLRSRRSIIGKSPRRSKASPRVRITCSTPSTDFGSRITSKPVAWSRRLVSASRRNVLSLFLFWMEWFRISERTETLPTQNLKKHFVFKIVCRWAVDDLILSFLDAPSHLYKRVCPSVRPALFSAGWGKLKNF